MNPGRDFRILGQACLQLEAEFGLIATNHQTGKTVGEGRADDMGRMKLRLYVAAMELIRVQRERLLSLGPRFERERTQLLRELDRRETRVVVWAAKG